MRIWDLFFGIFVLLPILSGGIWISQNKLRLEYTQPGPAAAILAIWLWLALKKKKSPSVLFEKRHEIFARWKTFIDKKNGLFWLWILFSLWWFFAGLAKHYNFRSNAIDLGIFTNAIWNIAHIGSAFSSIKGGISLISDHQNFIIYPIALIFKLFPQVETLLFIQACALSSTALAVFYLAKQRSNSDLMYFLPLAVWLYAPIRSAIVFDFHPEVLMLPLFLFGILGLQSPSNRAKFFGAFLFLAGILSKESGGPVAVGIGLAWILGAGPASTKSFTRVAGVLAILLGISLFLFDTKFLPTILGTKYIYQGTYEPFGSSVLDLIRAPFTYPKEFFSRLFGIARWKFFLALVVPFAFLPLLSPRALIAALPGFFMLFLTSTDQRVSLGYHYAIEPAVGVFFALSAAVISPYFLKHQKKFLYALIFLSLLLMGRSESYQMRIYSSSSHLHWLRKELIPQLSPQVSIAASSEVVPHIASRKWVHYLPIIWIEGIQEFKLTDCVLWEKSLQNSYLEPEHQKIMEERLEKFYSKEFECNTLHLYKNNGYSGTCLLQRPACSKEQFPSP